MSFETLSLELKTMIFSHFSTDELLSIISPVSNNWKHIALQPMLWKTLRFHGENYTNKCGNNEMVEHINRLFLVRRVIFSSFSDFNWSTTLNNLKYLRAIKFTECRFDIKEFSTLVDCTPNVNSFHCHESGLKIEVSDDKRIFVPHIIDLNMMTKITEWQKLRSIRLTECQFDHSINDDEFGNNHNEYLLLIANQCKSIEKIRVPHFTRIETSFKTLLELRGSQLKVLEFLGSAFRWETYKWLTYCVNLRKLTMNNTCFIRKQEFIELSKLRHLKDLTASKCVDCCFDTYSYYKLDDKDDFCFKRLKKADTCGMINWSEEVVKKHFPRLEKLNGLPVKKGLRKLRKYN